MRRPLQRCLLVAWLAGAAGCVDTSSRCHTPATWKPCPGAAAEPGAGGTPPTIVLLSLPTCAYLETPSAAGMLHVTDPEADAQVVKASFYAGGRVNEAELQLDDAHRSAADWSGGLSIGAPDAMANGGERTFDVRIKVADRAGNQSAPMCNTFSLIR